MIPGGDTRILAGDTIVLSVPAYESGGQEHLEEQEITQSIVGAIKPLRS